MLRHTWVWAVLLTACGNHKEDIPPPPPPASHPAPPPAPAPKPVPAEQPPAPVTPALAPGTPPPDGKYERVVVDGVTVPMIEVMAGGTVILVDTDGKKPRTWEEQYKQKAATTRGHYDVHKTDANKNGKFDDDPIDKEGLWVIDDKGNLTRH